MEAGEAAACQAAAEGKRHGQPQESLLHPSSAEGRRPYDPLYSHCPAAEGVAWRSVMTQPSASAANRWESSGVIDLHPLEDGGAETQPLATVATRWDSGGVIDLQRLDDGGAETERSATATTRLDSGGVVDLQPLEGGGAETRPSATTATRWDSVGVIDLHPLVG